jgi:AcrR family transcriptional regulator
MPPESATIKEIAGRSAILRAAESLFASSGYQDISIDGISQAAGVSRGLVHYHFRSKEELFMELVKEVMSEFSDNLRGALDACHTSREKIHALLLAFLSLAENKRSLWRTGVSDAGGLGSRVAQMFASYRQHYVAVITEVLNEGVTSGELKPMDTQFVAYCLMGIITSTAMGKFLSSLRLGADVVADRIATLLLDGVAK